MFSPAGEGNLSQPGTDKQFYSANPRPRDPTGSRCKNKQFLSSTSLNFLTFSSNLLLRRVILLTKPASSQVTSASLLRLSPARLPNCHNTLTKHICDFHGNWKYVLCQHTSIKNKYWHIRYHQVGCNFSSHHAGQFKNTLKLNCIFFVLNHESNQSYSTLLQWWQGEVAWY